MEISLLYPEKEQYQWVGREEGINDTELCRPPTESMDFIQGTNNVRCTLSHQAFVHVVFSGRTALPLHLPG